MKIPKLLKSAGLRQSAIMIVGNSLAAGIAAIALIIFSRFLGPEKFGVFSVGFALMQLVVRLADGGFSIAVQKKVAQTFESNQKKAHQYIIAGFKARAIITIVLLTLGLIFTPIIASGLLKTDNYLIIRLALLFSLVTVAFEYTALILQSIRYFFSSVIMSLVQSIVKLLLALAVLFVKTGDTIVVFSIYALSPIFGVLSGIISLPSWIRKRGNAPKSAYKSLINIVKFTSIAVISAAIGDNIDVLMVKSFLTEYDTGLFAAGVRISMLISLVALSLGTVLGPRVARYQTKEHFTKYTKKAFILVLISLIAIVVIVPFSGLLIKITAGNEYLAATTSLKYLLASGMFVVATTPLLAMFYAFDRPQYFALAGIIQTVILISANIILIPIMGINGAGIAKLMARSAVFIFSALYAASSINKKYKLNIFQLLK